jgi:acetyl esterase/lipase
VKLNLQNCFGLILLLSANAISIAADSASGSNASSNAKVQLDLWPQSPPAWIGTNEAERDTSGSDGRDVAGKPVIRLGHVSKPQLHYFPAAADRVKDPETVILICPGGGYSILAWDLEGTEIASQFNALGYSAAVVKYRVPTRQTDQAWLPPVQDIQRAVSMLRQSSSSQGNDFHFKRVGVVGFSAGGNAAARVATAAGKRFYDAIDAVDNASCQVDFAGLIYPWLMIEDPAKAKADNTKPHGIIPDLTINESTPPMFFTHAIDDGISYRNSSELFDVVRAKGVKAELHVFGSGGHGFGARDRNLAAATWPAQMALWISTLYPQP